MLGPLRPFMWQPAPVCELYSEAGQLPEPTPQPASSSLAPEFGLPPPTFINDVHPVPYCRRNGNTWETSGPNWEHPHETSLRLQVDELTKRNNSYYEQINNLDKENGQLVRVVQDLHNAAANVMRHGRTREVELPAHPRLRLNNDGYTSHVSPGGVDFRDREITRLDEQLTIINERLKATEEESKRKDSKIAILTSFVETHANERDEAKEELAKERSDSINKLNLKSQEQAECAGTFKKQTVAYEKEITDRDSVIRSFQVDVTERNNAIQSWSNSWQGLKKECEYWQEKMNSLEAFWMDHSSNQRRELDDYRRDHKQEMERMNAFCTEKDRVIGKQQENIAWAGKLLKQRDEELEEMQKNMRTVLDDREQALRASERPVRWIADESGVVTGDQPGHESKNDNKPARSTTLRDDASTQGEVIEVIEEEPSPPSLPKRPIRQDATDRKDRPQAIPRLPVVDDLPVDWGLPNAAPMESPNPGPRYEKRRRGRSSGRQKRTSQRQYPELNRGAATNLFMNPPTVFWPPASQSDRVTKSRRPQSDVSAERPGGGRPPISVHVTDGMYHDAPEEDPWKGFGGNYRHSISSGSPPKKHARRLVSETNLRGASFDQTFPRRDHLSKQRSMMELPKRPLHAYVEDENESRG